MFIGEVWQDKERPGIVTCTARGGMKQARLVFFVVFSVGVC